MYYDNMLQDTISLYIIESYDNTYNVNDIYNTAYLYYKTSYKRERAQIYDEHEIYKAKQEALEVVKSL
jgi:hypothetical protein